MLFFLIWYQKICKKPWRLYFVDWSSTGCRRLQEHWQTASRVEHPVSAANWKCRHVGVCSLMTSQRRWWSFFICFSYKAIPDWKPRRLAAFKLDRQTDSTDFYRPSASHSSRHHSACFCLGMWEWTSWNGTGMVFFVRVSLGKQGKTSWFV